MRPGSAVHVARSDPGFESDLNIIRSDARARRARPQSLTSAGSPPQLGRSAASSSKMRRRRRTAARRTFHGRAGFRPALLRRRRPRSSGPAAGAGRGSRVSERRLHHADSAAFRHAMRALSSGVAIVACGDGDESVGCTVTSLASLSLTPPTLFICLARSSTTLARLREVSAFSVNLLAARHEALAHRFSGRGGVHGPRRFADARWITLATGAPNSRRLAGRLRLPGRGGDRTAFARHRARRGREPQGRPRGAGARPLARGLRAVALNRLTPGQWRGRTSRRRGRGASWRATSS